MKTYRCNFNQTSVSLEQPQGSLSLKSVMLQHEDHYSSRCNTQLWFRPLLLKKKVRPKYILGMHIASSECKMSPLLHKNAARKACICFKEEINLAPPPQKKTKILQRKNFLHEYCEYLIGTSLVTFWFCFSLG